MGISILVREKTHGALSIKMPSCQNRDQSSIQYGVSCMVKTASLYWNVSHDYSISHSSKFWVYTDVLMILNILGWISFRKHKNKFAFSLISQYRGGSGGWNQYHGSWGPSDERSQGISSHGIDLVCCEYFCFSTTRVNQSKNYPVIKMTTTLIYLRSRAIDMQCYVFKSYDGVI